jgi:hypothetical protein
MAVNAKYRWRTAAAALVLALAAAGCGRGGTADTANSAVTINSASAPALAAPGNNVAAAQAAEPDGSGEPVDAAEPMAQAGEEKERRGPTRKARCRIDDEPERPCDFTPVLRDGSFDIEMPDRQLRLVVSGDEAAPFELIGTRRIPVLGLLRRDPGDRACWISQDEDAMLKRVCAR